MMYFNNKILIITYILPLAPSKGGKFSIEQLHTICVYNSNPFGGGNISIEKLLKIWECTSSPSKGGNVSIEQFLKNWV